MCTVTFIPTRNKLYFTSNRDERAARAESIPPAMYTHVGKVLYPKDADAGGTWIAAHENGNVIVLLNGAVRKHVPQPPYRKSRGLILLNLIDSVTPVNSFRAVNLNNIEPFTVIVYDDGHLFQCQWDGHHKNSHALDEKKPQIWSSVTLYDEKAISKRQQWFSAWLKEHPKPTLNDILRFHQSTYDGDLRNSFKMNRSEVLTVSVTSVVLDEEFASMHHVDLRNNKTSTQEIAIEKSMAGR